MDCRSAITSSLPSPFLLPCSSLLIPFPLLSSPLATADTPLLAAWQDRCVTAIASSLPSPRPSDRVPLSSLLPNASLTAWQDGSGGALPRCGTCWSPGWWSARRCSGIASPVRELAAAAKTPHGKRSSCRWEREPFSSSRACSCKPWRRSCNKTCSSKRAGTSAVCVRRLWKGRSIFSRATENGPAFCVNICVCKQDGAKCRPSCNSYKPWRSSCNKPLGQTPSKLSS